MKQVLQQLGTGETTLADVPAPAAARSGVVIRTRCSLISAGTERMLVEFGRAGWLDKMHQQPAKVRQVLDKIRTDGIVPTLEAVRSKLDQPIPLGYCNVGIAIEVGDEVAGIRVGDRIVSNGPHAEFVAVPKNLCARIPESVSDEAASFTVLGAIGLQGIRLAQPTLGEAFIVTGLGLIGLITVQLLRANGCRVLGIDPDPTKTALARRFGAETVDVGSGEDPLVAANAFSRGRGVDGVIITAATRSNDPVTQAAKMCRQRGRIVLVGVAGLELDRNDFYQKELTFQVSCSYGPGRYDSNYEEGGNDYPHGLVRWTEQRNFEAVLDMLSSGALDVAPLISHRFALAEASGAYDLLVSGQASYLGILLQYPESDAFASPLRVLPIRSQAVSVERSTVGATVAFVGAGNYAGRVLMPAFAAAGARLIGVASKGGVTAAHHASKHGFAEATTDSTRLITDARVNTVVIVTRHDTHAKFATEAIAAGKHVFIEKPLAIDAEQLGNIEAAWRVAPEARKPLVMVGFNRRFAPHVVRMKALLDSVAMPKTLIATVNAGAIPADHWTQQMHIGGGRIIGEGCHFIDLMRFLVGAPIERWQVATVGAHPGESMPHDKATITLSFADGSMGTLHYFANGHASFPKERIEAFCAGKILQLDNFRQLRGYGWNGFSSMKLWRQDKGQRECVAAFVKAVEQGGPAPIPFDELVEIARVTIALGEAARR